MFPSCIINKSWKGDYRPALLNSTARLGWGERGVLPKNQITRRNLLNLCFKLKKRKEKP